MKKEDIKKVARNLYVQGKFSQAEVARQVGKAPSQINRWAKAGKWQQLRASITVTPDTIIAQTYAQIQCIYDMAEEEDRPVDSTETDQISKLLAGVRQLNKDADLSLYTQVMGEFILYIRKQDAGLLEELATYQMDFLTRKAKQLANG